MISGEVMNEGEYMKQQEIFREVWIRGIKKKNYKNKDILDGSKINERIGDRCEKRNRIKLRKRIE